MKRQRSYGDDLDDDRRRLYDRAPPPPPPPRRRPVEYEGDGFERRKGFGGGGGFYAHRYRESPSPRGYGGGGGGGGRAMHRSESFSGFRREFPKGFRSERDRSRRDGGGSAWRRSGGGWKDGEDPEGHRARARRSGSSSLTPPPLPPAAAAGDRSDHRRRLESGKVEKSRKVSCSTTEMEEGEVAPDPELKREALLAAEPARRVDSERPKEKEPETSGRNEANSEKMGDLGTEGKLENVASCADDRAGEEGAGEEEAKIGNAVVDAARQVAGRLHDERLPEVEEKESTEDEAKERDETATVVDVCVESKREEAATAVKSNSSRVAQEVPHVEASPSGFPSSAQMKESAKEPVIEEQEEEYTESVLSQPAKGELEMNHSTGTCAVDETEAGREQEGATEHNFEEKQGKRLGREAVSEGANVLFPSVEEDVGESKCNGMALNLIAERPNAEDKGKGIAFEVFSKEHNLEEDNTCNAGASGRGFDFAFRSHVDHEVASQSVGTSSAKQEDDAIKMGSLDLSLRLPGGSESSKFTGLAPKPDSPPCPASCQSLPSSSFHMNSEGFMASMSFTNSRTFVHNPSCSLTQQPFDNCEHSVGSKPIFQGVDQASASTVWQAQWSNESKLKGGAAPLLQRVLQNGHASSTFEAVNGQHHGISSELQRRASSPNLLSPTQSHVSHDSRLEYSRVRRQLTRERSGSSLLRSERQEGEQLVLNGAGVIERVVSKIVSEPLHLAGRMLQEMTEHSISYLREAISEIVIGADKTGKISALQEALHKRSDLNSEMLQRCPRVLLEMLVAIKTGLPDFIRKNNSMRTSDLVEIFLNLKCRNLACQSMLPIDDCDCKVCQRQSGFCSSCMCIVCSKFDLASNTCGWVGCDVCLHWCHTDCGLRHSLIRKGVGGSREYGTNEMQFHCAACGHPSEMFGFVKEVFRTCVKEWKVETLIRELKYVERIFSQSDDARGKRLRSFVNQMLVKLEDKASHSEVVEYIRSFLSDVDSNVDISPSLPLRGTPCIIAEERNLIPSSIRETTWLQSVPLEKVSFLGKAGVLSTIESKSMTRRIGEAELQVVEEKPVVDELDSLVRLKQAEAKMYQERANDARKEAETLKHIAMAKSARIEDEYATQIAKLSLGELEERRKQKIEELQVIERTHQQYFSMKMRMETNIRELLLKMEEAKHNLST